MQSSAAEAPADTDNFKLSRFANVNQIATLAVVAKDRMYATPLAEHDAQAMFARIGVFPTKQSSTSAALFGGAR